MASPRAARLPARRTRSRRRRSTLPQRFSRWLKQVRRAWRKLAAAPRAVRVAVVIAAALTLFSATNIVYQMLRKPTEMFFPVSGALNKMPDETWRDYAPLFRRYSTSVVSPELLAALAQVESAGNPVARTYWRWRLTWHPFGIYKPASSAVGMYQMTDPAFAEARHYCIRHHAVVEEGCWFNGLYTRVLPGDAVELASVYLSRQAAGILDDFPKARPGARQMQELATLIHLCGAGPARDFARRGFHLAAGERCGDSDAADYLSRVETMKRRFRRLAAEE